MDDLKIFLFCNVCTEKDLSFCQKLRFSNRFFAILLYQSSKYQRFLPEGGKILGIEHLSLWQILNFFTSLDLHAEVLMQGKLYQRCTHLLYCSVLSLGGNVNTRPMSKPDMGSIFHINNQWNILVRWNYYVNYQNYQNSMLLTSSDSKLTLGHLFLFTNSAQIELVSICTQSIRDRN